MSSRKRQKESIVPSTFKTARACTGCALLKTVQQFDDNGCENCGNDYSPCTQNYEGVIAIMNPKQSWIARRLVANITKQKNNYLNNSISKHYYCPRGRNVIQCYDEDDGNIKENEIGYNNNANNNNSSIFTTQNENRDSFGYKLESLNHSSKLIVKIDEKQLQMADEKVKARDWGNIWIVFLVLFLSESARGLVLPTISLYVLYVGGGSSFLGVVVSSFSAGRFVSTVLLGYLSSKFQYKKVFLSAVFICIVGLILYCFAFLDIGNTGKTLLVILRILLGFGAGTLSCVRAYISEVSTNEERTSYLTWASAIQFLGFSITPIIGSTLAYVPMFYIEGPVKVGLLTLPGWALLISNVGLILILLFRFSNPPKKQQETIIQDVEKQDIKQPILKSEIPKQSVFTLIKNDKQVLKTLIVFILLNFFVRGILGILETLGTPIYTLLNDDIDNTSGYFFGCMGIIGIVVLFGLSYISKNKLIDDFWVLLIGNTIIAFGCAICIRNELG